MTQFETLTAIFDTAVWAIAGDSFAIDEKRKIIDELHGVLHAMNDGYEHEKFKCINGTWTQSGSCTGWCIAKTCLNKRHSFFIVMQGQVVALTENEASYLRPGGWLEMKSNNSAILLATPDTRVMRVFVDDLEALKSFAEKYDA